MDLLRNTSQNFTRAAMGAALLMLAGSLSAATLTSVAPGAWNAPATWGGSTPTATDDVVIETAVTINSAAAATNVTINTGGTLSFSGANSLTLTGDLTRNGTGALTMTNTNGQQIIFSGGAAQSINGGFSGSNAIRRMNVNKTANTVVTANGTNEIVTLLQLTSGVLSIPSSDSFTVLLDGPDGAPQSGVVSPSDNGIVLGTLRRIVDRTKAGSRSFYTGTVSSGTYQSSNVRITVTAGQAAGVGVITASANKGKAPWPTPIPSGMNPDDVLDRYWRVNMSGFGSGSLAHNIRLNYVTTAPTDFQGGMIESNNLRPVRFVEEIANGNFWTTGGTTVQVEGASDRITANGQNQPNDSERVWTVFESAALRVDLASFTGEALEGGAGVRLDWVTAGEVDNAGFNVYRALSGFDGAVVAGQRLTPAPIPAVGDGTVGGTYGFVDDSALLAGETRSYVLEDIDLNGIRTLHGPISVTWGEAAAGDTKSVSNALNNLTAEFWQSASTSDFAAPAFSAAAGLGASVPAGATGVFGYWETKSALEALPAGEYRLRALVEWTRADGATLPQLRSRVFPSGHVTSWSTVVNDRPNSSVPTTVETSFTSDGATPFRVAFDVLGFGPGVGGGFVVKKVEIVPAN